MSWRLRLDWLRLWLYLSSVGGDRPLNVVDEVGAEALQSFSVIPPHDGRAEREPEDQAGCRSDDSSGQTGVAGTVEVENRAGAREDLAQRLDLANELEGAG